MAALAAVSNSTVVKLSAAIFAITPGDKLQRLEEGTTVLVTGQQEWDGMRVVEVDGEPLLVCESHLHQRSKPAQAA